MSVDMTTASDYFHRMLFIPVCTEHWEVIRICLYSKRDYLTVDNQDCFYHIETIPHYEEDSGIAAFTNLSRGINDRP